MATVSTAVVPSATDGGGDLRLPEVPAQDAPPYGATTHKTDDDILVLGPADHLLDVREFLYETTMLGMPLRRAHEDIEDCDQEVVRWLTGSVDDAPDDVQEEEMDPRWAALKGLGSDEDEKLD